MKPELVRCAIYTRKSSDEGLEQEFNSLDAQYEACAAYVTSQVGEGWTLVDERYDDGGISGGTMDRPALLRLLGDVQMGHVDVVVVYKVDRLTRSITDFGRIVETLDANDASFVSVTQAFNTTTSMGRLTLNVLLSFAQFEREVTGERIRDKIAASKAKGLWMGGNPPLGYDPDGRTLKINNEEAETVRLIFQRYLELGTVARLAADLERRGVLSKSWTSTRGRACGGRLLSRGALYALLKNRIYRGLIMHKGVAFPGRHHAIVDADLFDAAQRLLERNRTRRSAAIAALRPGALLRGLLFDAFGDPMSPTTARKGAHKYGYYASQSCLRGAREQAPELARVSAAAIETLVVDAVAPLLPAGRRASNDTSARVRAAINRVEAHADHVEIVLNDQHLGPMRRSAGETRPNGQRVVTVSAVLGRRKNGEAVFLNPSGEMMTPPRAHNSWPTAIARGFVWRQMLERGEVAHIEELARKVGFSSRYTGKVLRLSWLAPDIVEAILAGFRPTRIALRDVLEGNLPLSWADQRQLLGLKPAL